MARRNDFNNVAVVILLSINAVVGSHMDMAQTGRYQEYKETDGDIAPYMSNLDACRLRCNNMPECTGLTTHEHDDNIYCYLHKGDVDKKLVPAEETWTRTYSEKLDWDMGPVENGWYQEYNVTRDIAPYMSNLDDCRLRCNNMPECTGLTTHKHGDNIYCYLHKGDVDKREVPAEEEWTRTYSDKLYRGSYIGPAQMHRYQEYDNEEDFPPYVVLDQTTADADNCKAHCNNMPSCTGLTIHSNLKLNKNLIKCFLHKIKKEIKEEVRNQNPNFDIHYRTYYEKLYSGSHMYMAQTGRYQEYKETDGDIAPYKSNLDACRLRCNNMPECTGLTTHEHPDGIYCYLHKGDVDISDVPAEEDWTRTYSEKFYPV